MMSIIFTWLTISIIFNFSIILNKEYSFLNYVISPFEITKRNKIRKLRSKMFFFWMPTKRKRRRRSNLTNKDNYLIGYLINREVNIFSSHFCLHFSLLVDIFYIRLYNFWHYQYKKIFFFPYLLLLYVGQIYIMAIVFPALLIYFHMRFKTSKYRPRGKRSLNDI